LPGCSYTYRAKTKGKVERPYRYVGQYFFLGRHFRNMDDLNRQLEDWPGTLANTTQNGQSDWDVINLVE
jgi:transposase